MSEKLFYVQDARQYVGNSMLWWKHDNCGYVCNIKEAKVFTQAEIDGMCSINEGSKKAWPKEYIDERKEDHIDMQSCNHDEATSQRI